jgi:hypothetical protein
LQSVRQPTTIPPTDPAAPMAAPAWYSRHLAVIQRILEVEARALRTGGGQAGGRWLEQVRGFNHSASLDSFSPFDIYHIPPEVAGLQSRRPRKKGLEGTKNVTN